MEICLVGASVYDGVLVAHLLVMAADIQMAHDDADAAHPRGAAYVKALRPGSEKIGGAESVVVGHGEQWLSGPRGKDGVGGVECSGQFPAWRINVEQNCFDCW